MDNSTLFMLLSPLSHGLLALLLTGAYGAPLDDTIFCRKEFWGSPPVLPCRTMLAGFASHTDSQPRYFDEEQLRANGLNWPGVYNNFPTEVVQLPAYWSSGQYRSLAWRKSTLTYTPIFLS